MSIFDRPAPRWVNWLGNVCLLISLVLLVAAFVGYRADQRREIEECARNCTALTALDATTCVRMCR